MPTEETIVMFTIAPPVEDMLCENTSRHMVKVPTRLVSTTARKPFVEMDCGGASRRGR